MLMRTNCSQQPAMAPYKIQHPANRSAWEFFSPCSPVVVPPPYQQIATIPRQLDFPVDRSVAMLALPGVDYGRHSHYTTPPSTCHPSTVLPHRSTTARTSTTSRSVNASRGVVEIEYRKVIIKGLDCRTTKSRILELCERSGDLETWDYLGDNNRGIVLATYRSHTAAVRARAYIHGKEVGKAKVMAYIAKDADAVGMDSSSFDTSYPSNDLGFASKHSYPSADTESARRHHKSSNSSRHKSIDVRSAERSHRSRGHSIPRRREYQAADMPVIANGSR